MEAGLPPNPLVTRLREGVTGWQAVLPAIAALRNTDLRERHWVAVGAVLGLPPIDRGSLTLADVLQLGVSAVGGWAHANKSTHVGCPAQPAVSANKQPT
jgi:hypothetical protein